jgi:hypothetical protein
MSIPMENQHIGLKGYDFGGALFSGVSSHDFNLVSVFMILPLGEKRQSKFLAKNTDAVMTTELMLNIKIIMQFAIAYPQTQSSNPQIKTLSCKYFNKIWR